MLTEQEDGSLGNSPSKDGYYSDKTTKMVFTDVEVLAVKADDDMYILKVDAHQGEEIAHIQASGDGGAFTLMLRAEGDARVLEREGYGETTDRFYHPVRLRAAQGHRRRPVPPAAAGGGLA